MAVRIHSQKTIAEHVSRKMIVVFFKLNGISCCHMRALWKALKNRMMDATVFLNSFFPPFPLFGLYSFAVEIEVKKPKRNKILFFWGVSIFSPIFSTFSSSIIFLLCAADDKGRLRVGFLSWKGSMSEAAQPRCVRFMKCLSTSANQYWRTSQEH